MDSFLKNGVTKKIIGTFILFSPLYNIVFFIILFQWGNLNNWRYLMWAILISSLMAVFSWKLYPKSKKIKPLHPVTKIFLMFTYCLIFLWSLQVYFQGVKVASGPCILKNEHGGRYGANYLQVNSATGVHKFFLRMNVFYTLKGKFVGNSTYLCNRFVTIHYLSNSALLDIK